MFRVQAQALFFSILLTFLCAPRVSSGGSEPSSPKEVPSPQESYNELSKSTNSLLETAKLNRRILELYGAGQSKSAIPLAERAVALTESAKGHTSPDTAASLNTLGELYEAIGEYDKAEPLFIEALEIRRKTLGPEHPDTAQSLNSLAELYMARGEYDRAEPLFIDALKIQEKLLAPESPQTTAIRYNLAKLYSARGDHAKAKGLLDQLNPPLAKWSTSLREYIEGGEYARALTTLKIERKLLPPPGATPPPKADRLLEGAPPPEATPTPDQSRLVPVLYATNRAPETATAGGAELQQFSP